MRLEERKNLTDERLEHLRRAIAGIPWVVTPDNIGEAIEFLVNDGSAANPDETWLFDDDDVKAMSGIAEELWEEAAESNPLWAAKARVDGNGDLEVVRWSLYYDWDNVSGHLRWVATAPVGDILGWADTVVVSDNDEEEM